ncbi:hypothetical protein [Mycobacterium sp.]|uniref:hypothetical protein n=1 Tax=Mycobacterium sp. TaxID=1785 RepID=UPI003F9809E2
MQRRQVIDIPEPAPLQVTEYQRISKACPGCGAVTAAGWDEPAVPKRTRRDRRRAWLASAYRPQTLAQAALLTCAHYLPVGRSRNLLQQLTAIEVSTGFLAGIRARSAAHGAKVPGPHARTAGIGAGATC